MTYQPPCALELKSELPDILRRRPAVCVCASFLSPLWFLRSNYLKLSKCIIWDGLTCDGTLRIQSHYDQELQACHTNTASLHSRGCEVK